MPGKAIFIAPLIGLECPGTSNGRGFEVTEGVYLSKDSDFYDKLIRRHFEDSTDRRTVVYKQELLLEGLARRPFLYADWTVPDGDPDLSRQGEAFLDEWIHFNQALWLVKDNSTNFQRCAGVGSLSKARHTLPWRSTKIDWCFDSSGAQATTVYSVDELRRSRTYFEQSGELLLGLEGSTSVRGGVLLVKAHRLVRANFFLIIARHQGLLPLRIAQYITCLEALVATTQDELKHRLCERAALFLEVEGSKQQELYGTLSLAYKVRSAVVHGDVVKIDASRLIDVSRQCDDVIRRCFVKILQDPELRVLFDQKASSADQVERYFNNLLFRRSP